MGRYWRKNPAKAAVIGEERLRQAEAVLCICLEGIPLEERVYEGFVAPGSTPGRIRLFKARSRAKVSHFDKSDLDEIGRSVGTIYTGNLPSYVLRALEWFQTAYWERNVTARFVKYFLTSLALIEGWADQHPELVPPRETDGGKNESPKAKARAYLKHHIHLDKEEDCFQYFDRLYRARHKVFKAALLDTVTKDVLHEAEALALSFLQFELFGHFREDRFVVA